MIFSAIFVSRKQRGFSFFELTIAVIVVAILSGLLLLRIRNFQVEAEHAAVKMIVSNIRSAIEITAMQAKLSSSSEDLTLLTEENPFNLLKVKPANYVGELYSPSAEEIGKGNWCFDRADKSLIYLLNHENSFKNSQIKMLRFKVELRRLPQNPAKPPGAPEFYGVAFDQVSD
ncbi:prepilin-type N-terminal cleavage/methylation domain-containing protein [Duganella sp. FT94W]|uniref:Prepilin-type N-terminal cleavage/methylation domain-containing protein n=1 Tax=Duganella lactea TaxID=2692173 RepID=A0ABW9V4S9_9BURK|nr:prepilin-type N-terminal cleavage/methylation domain-containing protein [Duganella lactea]MYM34573.1 prepilin-type N-terminal cleavage/methylation domain-containing protein [Duganella lactea]